MRNNASQAEGLFQAAIRQHQAGSLSQAEAICHQILQVEPNHPDALHLSGVIAHQTGREEDAIAFINKAIAANPSESAYYNTLGLVFRDLGRLDDAVTLYSKALSIKPNNIKSHYSLGNALQMLGRFDEAISAYQKAILIKSDFAEAHGNMGSAFLGQGRFNEAIACYRKAISIKPDYPEAHNNQGIALFKMGWLDEAATCCRQALSLRSNYAEAYHNLGNILREQGKLEEAISLTQRALSLKPDYTEAHVNLAWLFIDSGQFDSAQAELSEVLRINPKHPVAWIMQTELRKTDQGNNDWLDVAIEMSAQLSSVLSEEESIMLQFAIGKHYDGTKQYDLAFAAYRQANAQKLKLVGKFDRAKFSCFVDDLILTYTADSMRKLHEGASSSPLPVFIVGMPRSGTSLIEQIIASHPQAYGCGELGYWLSLTDHEILMASSNPSLLAKTAAEYEKFLRQYSHDAERIVDKMPHNFCRLGLIHMAFPQARIIHAQRDPIDTCLSIHFQNFKPTAHPYAADLDDLAFYYKEYNRLMHHWRAVLPAECFLDVPYEELIDDQARWSQRIIDFIGLTWNERCLDFHKTERRVGTASNWQVRQKIYKSSKARWLNYEEHIGPLLCLLDIK